MFTKLFAGSFFTLGLLLTGAIVADEVAGDCCSAQQACCQDKAACCQAAARLGCCVQGQNCCAEQAGCCAVAEQCCVEGSACCNKAKSCCGPAQAGAKTSGCHAGGAAAQNCCEPTAKTSA